MIAPRRLALLLPFALLVGCKSGKSSGEHVLTDSERAELRKIVEENMKTLTATMQLSQTQIDNIQPYLSKASDALFTAARAYHANPNEKALRKYQADTRLIGADLRASIQPFMTNAQLNNFMVVLDRTLQSVQVARIQRGA